MSLNDVFKWLGKRKLKMIGPFDDPCREIWNVP